MKHVVTTGIVLKRINYGEADRILTLITPDHGKVRLMAKGVRREKSKLAGGIELFSTTNITFIPGKRDISTLVSSRLLAHYGQIVKDFERTTIAYDVLKIIDKVTQDECEAAYYQLLHQILEALDDSQIDMALVEVWFCVRLLKLLGHEPNLQTDTNGDKLQQGGKFQFDFEAMSFYGQPTGPFDSRHIKLLRLAITHPLAQLCNVEAVQRLSQDLRPLCKGLVSQSTQA